LFKLSATRNRVKWRCGARLARDDHLRLRYIPQQLDRRGLTRSLVPANSDRDLERSSSAGGDHGAAFVPGGPGTPDGGGTWQPHMTWMRTENS
jgi:hypothetical protein